MAFVRRRDRFGDMKITSRHWSSLTKAEKGRKLYGRSAAAIAAGSLIVTYGAEVLGTPDENISRDDQTAQLRSEVQKTYDQASPRKKYTVGYIQPIRSRAAEIIDQGTNIRGTISENRHFKAVIIRAGRSCLRNTAYDIEQGESAAALKATDSSVTVYPSVERAPELHFSIDPIGGDLDPTKQTAKILKGYDCRFMGTIPVRTAFVEVDTYQQDHEWQLIEPLRATVEQ